MDDAGLIIHANINLALRGLRLHARVPLVAFLGLVYLWIAHPLPFLSLPSQTDFTLVKVELGASIKVPSMIVPFFMAMPLALKWPLDYADDSATVPSRP